MIDILLPSLILSVILLIVHSYFGIQIIRRGVIFTDLAVGQMAALGVAISVYLFEGMYIYFFSLSLALIASLLIAYIQHRKDDTQEAFIGLLYALGISGVFIVMSRSPHGLDELNNLLAYDILFTGYIEIYKVAVLYLIVGALIYFLVEKSEGLKRELAFFALFAITLTSSVKLAGVLVVFSILIAPTLVSLKLFKKNHILKSTIIGSGLILFSLFLSYNFDLPTGYTIVFINALTAVIISLYKN